MLVATGAIEYQLPIKLKHLFRDNLAMHGKEKIYVFPGKCTNTRKSLYDGKTLDLVTANDSAITCLKALR